MGRLRQNRCVRILLPPSETKSIGGDGPTLDLGELSFDELSPTRTRLVKALMAVSERPRASFSALGLSKSQAGELQRNLDLPESPTMPAIERYTGVLYDALDVTSLTEAARRRADERLVITSALFGLVGARDMIPAYRMSAGARLPRLGTLASIWKPATTTVMQQMQDDHLIVDLRSGPYRTLAPAPHGVAVQVLSEQADGSRRVVSHANKSTRGQVARLLATARTKPASRDDVVALLADAGMCVETTDDTGIAVVLPLAPT